MVVIWWITRLPRPPKPRRFLPVPRGLLKGTGPRFHQGHRSPGAQPEIASKAVREDIEDRLHGQAAELRSSGRARRQVARDAFFSPLIHPFPSTVQLSTCL